MRARSPAAFLFFAQLLSLVPTRIGRWLRAAFYHRTLRACPRDVRIAFGAYIADVGTRIGRAVAVGHFSIVRRAVVGDGAVIGDWVLIGAAAGLPARPRRVSIGAQSHIGTHAVVLASVGAYAVVGPGAIVATPVAARATVAPRAMLPA